MNNVIDLEGEIWKPIDEFPNYMVSNKGRVKHLKFGKERLLKPGSTTKYGHQFVQLYKNGVRTKKSIHRLVATAFISNPDNKPEIDHIDTNPRNNCVDNLRWVTHHENNQNPLSIIHHRDSQGGKPIYCYETDTIYQSTWDVARQLNVYSSNVSKCCKGKYSSTGGYHFCYASELSDTYELFL